MKNNNKSILLAILIGLFNFTLFAQTPIRVAVADVKQEELFIDAQREKLLGNYEKAEEFFRNILEKTNPDATIYFSFAQVLSQLDKEEEAVKMAEKSVELDGTNLWYKIYLTEIYEKTGKDLKAAQVYENLVKSDPDNYEYYNSWAFYLIRAQEIEDAIEVYNSLEKKVGINAALTRKKHTLYVALGASKKATKELERLVEAFPKQLEYQHLLAEFYAQVGSEDKAKAIYEKILQLNPDDTKALMAAKGGKGTSGDAYSELRRIFEKPNIKIDDKIRELLPMIQDAVNTGDPNKLNTSLQLATILVNAHPEEAKAHAAYGDLLYHSGKLEAAKNAYQKTIELDESVYVVWEQLMYIHLQQKDYQTLASVSEEAIDLFPNQARVYFMNGIALNQLGEYEEAIDIFQEASFMVGQNSQLKLELLQQMGMTYQNWKQYEAADKSFDQALAIAPSAAPILNTYSYALAERGEQLNKAEILIQKAIKENPNLAVLEHTYAWVLYKKKDYKNARKQIEKALEKGEQALFLEHYGDILFELGEKQLALEQWKKAKQLGSKSAALDKKISEQS